jgi:hypothetical protein
MRKDGRTDRKTYMAKPLGDFYNLSLRTSLNPEASFTGDAPHMLYSISEYQTMDEVYTVYLPKTVQPCRFFSYLILYTIGRTP